MKHYDATVTVTFRLYDIHAENESEAEEYAYYHFDEGAYSADVEQVLTYETYDDEEDEDE